MKLQSILTFSPSSLLPLRGLRRASLLAVILLLVGCAPTASPEPIQPEAAVPTESEPTALLLPTATAAQPEAAPTEVPSTQIPPTEAPTEVPQVVATSRGPDLEATDPTMVSLNSGELQLVEFFRFT